MFGEVPEALGVMWHNQPVLKFSLGLGRKTAKWNECDKDLKSYAHMAVASLIGCSFCLDLGYFQAHNEGLDEAKAREVLRWRESDIFTPLERDVMEYAEAMSQTPPTVTDELSARLLERLGAPAMVELTAWVALANLYARTNVALVRANITVRLGRHHGFSCRSSTTGRGRLIPNISLCATLAGPPI